MSSQLAVACRQPGLGFGPERSVFVGLRSYAVVLTDPTFLSGLGTVALYCVIYIPLMVIGSLALALLLDSGVVRLRSWAQLGLFLPHAVPGIIAALIWLYLYTPGISPVVEAFAIFSETTRMRADCAKSPEAADFADARRGSLISSPS